MTRLLSPLLLGVAVAGGVCMLGFETYEIPSRPRYEVVRVASRPASAVFQQVSFRSEYREPSNVLTTREQDLASLVDTLRERHGVLCGQRSRSGVRILREAPERINVASIVCVPNVLQRCEVTASATVVVEGAIAGQLVLETPCAVIVRGQLHGEIRCNALAHIILAGGGDGKVELRRGSCVDVLHEMWRGVLDGEGDVKFYTRN